MRPWSKTTFDDLAYDYVLEIKNEAGYGDAVVQKFERAIGHWKAFNDSIGEDCKVINPLKVQKFKEYVRKLTFREKPVSVSTKKSIILNVKKLFSWTMKHYPQSQIEEHSLSLLKLNRAENNQLKGNKIVWYPAIDEIIYIVQPKPNDSIIITRVKMIIIFMLITGARCMATATMLLGAIDLQYMIVYQHPSLGVSTKYSKSINTTILELIPGARDALLKWCHDLRAAGFSDKDPLFPKAANEEKSEDSSAFTEAQGWTKEFISASTINREIKKLGKAKGLPRLHPHALRHAHVEAALKACKNGEEIKAISQNIGHEKVLTTLNQYGNKSPKDLHDTIVRINQRLIKPKINHKQQFCDLLEQNREQMNIDLYFKMYKAVLVMEDSDD
jgi:integrase